MRCLKLASLLLIEKGFDICSYFRPLSHRPRDHLVTTGRERKDVYALKGEWLLEPHSRRPRHWSVTLWQPLDADLATNISKLSTNYPLFPVSTARRGEYFQSSWHHKKGFGVEPSSTGWEIHVSLKTGGVQMVAKQSLAWGVTQREQLFSLSDCWLLIVLHFSCLPSIASFLLLSLVIAQKQTFSAMITSSNITCNPQFSFNFVLEIQHMVHPSRSWCLCGCLSTPDLKGGGGGTERERERDVCFVGSVKRWCKQNINKHQSYTTTCTGHSVHSTASFFFF